MKTQLFLVFFISQLSLGSHFCNDRIDNNSPTTIELYKRCEQGFVAVFCAKALEQNEDEIANRLGCFGFGNNWKGKIENIHYPFADDPIISVKQGEVLVRVAEDMLKKFPDYADWLKKNAK